MTEGIYYLWSMVQHSKQHLPPLLYYCQRLQPPATVLPYPWLSLVSTELCNALRIDLYFGSLVLIAQIRLSNWSGVLQLRQEDSLSQGTDSKGDWGSPGWATRILMGKSVLNAAKGLGQILVIYESPVCYQCIKNVHPDYDFCSEAEGPISQSLRRSSKWFSNIITVVTYSFSLLQV